MSAANLGAEPKVSVPPETLRAVAAGDQIGRDDHRVRITISGWVAVVTGPLMLTADDRTPSFALLSQLPGWPEVVALLVTLAGLAVLACQWGGHRQPLVGAIALYALGFLAGSYGLGLAVTYVLWAQDMGWAAWADYFVAIQVGGQPAPDEGRPPPIIITAPFWLGGALSAVLIATSLRVRERKRLPRVCATAPGA